MLHLLNIQTLWFFFVYWLIFFLSFQIDKMSEFQMVQGIVTSNQIQLVVRLPEMMFTMIINYSTVKKILYYVYSYPNNMKCVVYLQLFFVSATVSVLTSWMKIAPSWWPRKGWLKVRSSYCFTLLWHHLGICRALHVKQCTYRLKIARVSMRLETQPELQCFYFTFLKYLLQN